MFLKVVRNNGSYGRSQNVWFVLVLLNRVRERFLEVLDDPGSEIFVLLLDFVELAPSVLFTGVMSDHFWMSPSTYSFSFLVVGAS